MKQGIIGIFALFLVLVIPFISKAVTVGPVKLEISANPGDVVTGNLFLMNEGKETQTFYPVFETFIEEEGEKKFLKEEKSDLANWFKLPESVTLKPQEQKNIPFTLNIPKDARSGGHFAVIWWSTAPADLLSSKQVAVVTRAGILVYLTVAGEIKEELKVVSFKTDKKLYFNGPINFNLKLENTGNVYLKPQGEIVIKNLFGLTKTTLKANPKELIILPSSKKTISSLWETTAFAFGPYRAQLKLVYGESQKQILKTTWLFIFPYKFVIGIIFFGLFIFVILPTYNRWLIKRAKGS